MSKLRHKGPTQRSTDRTCRSIACRPHATIPSQFQVPQSGVLRKYADQIGAACKGAMTHAGGKAEVVCYADIERGTGIGTDGLRGGSDSVATCAGSVRPGGTRAGSHRLQDGLLCNRPAGPEGGRRQWQRYGQVLCRVLHGAYLRRQRRGAQRSSQGVHAVPQARRRERRHRSG